MAPRARFELATLRLTAEMIENLSALSGVAYEKLGAIFPHLVAPTSAPTVGYESTCFASAFAPSKPSLLCSAFLMFPTISGNLLLARSKPLSLNYIGFCYGKSTFVSTDFQRFSAPAFAACVRR